MKIILNSKKNYICTIAIGISHYNNWKSQILPSWKLYCKKNKIGIIVFTKDLIDKKNFYWKKPTWQKMLIGSELLKRKIKAENICYLDTDILINPLSPNIFKFHQNDKISLVSSRKFPNFDYYDSSKRVSFYRKKYYNKKYPLNSSILFTNKQTYKFHNLKPMPDEACMGLFIFNLKLFSSIMKNWFFKYNRYTKSFTGGGDQIHFNYEIQNNCKVNWLSYKFQMLWYFEMANNYPFLYEKNLSTNLIKKCILNTLRKGYFLHFAGSWGEGKLYLKTKFLKSDLCNLELRNFYNYLNKKFNAVPKGRILPKK